MISCGLTRCSIGLCVVRCRITRWAVGCFGVQGSWCTILGLAQCNCAVYASRTQEFWWVIKNRIMSVDLRRCSVISIDLSPAGNILATGSGDWQARICAFLNTPSICHYQTLIYVLFQGVTKPSSDHVWLDWSHLRVALFSCFSRVVTPIPCSAILSYIYTNQYMSNLP